MLQDLPPELISSITEFLVDDLDSLKTCTLLDDVWRDAARRHLFASITLTVESAYTLTTPIEEQSHDQDVTRRKLAALSSCLRRCPQLSGFIKTVKIENVCFLGSPGWAQLHEAVADFLLSCSCITHFCFSNVVWPQVSPELRESIIYILTHSPVNKISFIRVKIGALDALELLTLSPHLEAFELHGHKFSSQDHPFFVHDNDSDQAPAPKEDKVRPRSLYLSTSSSFHRSFSWITTHYDLSALSQLAVDILSSQNDAIVQNIIHLASFSLRRLELLSCTNTVRFQLPSNLTMLAISLTDGFSTLCGLLEAISAPISLRVLQIIVAVDEFPHDRNADPASCVALRELRNLDMLLTKRTFENLRWVRFTFRGNEEVILIEKFLPRVSGLGCVTLRVDWERP